MVLKIELSNKEVSCTFDKFGNLYVSIDGSKLYDIVISKNNTIALEEYCNTIAEFNGNSNGKDIIIGELKLIKDNNTLMGKAIDTLNEKNDDNYSDNDTELTENAERTYFSENLEYIEYIDEKSTREDSFVAFSVTSGGDELDNIVKDYGETGITLYDTLVFEGSPENSELLMKTTLVNDLTLYRLCLYTSGDILFRAIGSASKKYKLCYNENCLLLVLC